MKIAIAQLNPIIGDLTGNVAQILESADIAAVAGIRLLLTPELSLCGYPPRDLLLNPSFIDQIYQNLEILAVQLPETLAVLVGFVSFNLEGEIIGEKNIHNSVALIDEGKIKQIFHKQLLPTYDVFDEDRYFASGKKSNFFELYPRVPSESLQPPIPVKIGVTICEDLWNDESFWGKRNYAVNPLEELADSNVNLVVNLSASPYSIGKQKLREAMLHHGARRYQLPILYANQVGGNDDLIFDGSSVAFDRSGNVVCRAPAFKTNLLVLEFDQKTQDVHPLAESLQSNHTDWIAPLAADEEEELWGALVLGVRDYVRKCGFQKVVLGLSGGIDSALVAAIATEALGPEQVLGILMPSPYSSDHSIQDAEALVNLLGISSQTIPIAAAMNCYEQLLEPLFQGTTFGIAEENIQSRIRGNLLMAIANKFGHLLLSTGNKSEISVGYCTLYGDMNGGLSVIADVPKTKVFALCRWLNREQEIIPVNILKKPPSAELRPNQTDQDALPPYDILDDILDRFIHRHQGRDQIIAANHHPDTVDQVMNLVFKAEFKRRQAPPGLKVSDRAFGTGWRMPIACRWS